MAQKCPDVMWMVFVQSGGPTPIDNIKIVL